MLAPKEVHPLLRCRTLHKDAHRITRREKRQLARQLAGALFERVALSPAKLSPPVRELHPEAASVFKDSYLVEFLDLPKDHSEADLPMRPSLLKCKEIPALSRWQAGPPIGTAEN